MRKLARTVAKNMSYRKCGTMNMFDYFFEKIWRGNHPKSYSLNPTKKGRK